jgi:hypothetical protein
MENNQPKKKTAKKVVTTESIENGLIEFNQGAKEVNNNETIEIDLKKAENLLKKANQTIKNISNLIDDTFNEDNEMSEEDRAKNKDFLKKIMR